MNITSLVTGGAGFIGCHVAKHLIAKNHRVIVLDDLSGGDKNNIPSNAIFIEGSITDEALIHKIFNTYSITYVYHLAAYAAEGLSHFIRKFNYENNLIGSIHLINAAVNHNVKCFVFTSSIAVYGTNTLPMIESATPNPEDPYGIAKYAVELDLKTANNLFGLNFIIFRPHNVYGPFQNIGDKYRNVIGIFMNQILQDKPLSIFGDGEQSRAFSYIDDVAPYIAESVEHKEAYNHTFNLGSDTIHTVKELALTVCEVMNVPPNIIHLEKREEVVHAYANHKKFNSIFSPKQATDLKAGITEMAHWVKQHGIKKSNDFDAIEILKNLPNSWKK